MTALSITDLKARRAAAGKERDAMKPLLDEVYDYVIPYRRGIDSTSGGSVGAGEKRVNRIFELTAMNAAFRFPGKLQQDLCPPEEKWFTLELGPIGKRMSDAEATGKELEGISEILGTGVATGEWDTAFPEMGADLLNSTGFMLILEGEDDRWARFVCVPAHEMLIAPGPYSDIWFLAWSRKWTHANILATWPKGKFTEEFKRVAAEKPNDEVTVNQDTCWDPAKKKWCLYVWLDGYEGQMVHEVESYTCPWIAPRYFKLPGETWGRGLAMVAMPAIKTANKVVELTLKAAAIALLGIYTYTPHSQFNPDTARIEPGQFWPVASNGGVLGEGIKKLEAPRLDLTHIVLNELRMQIQSTLMDQALPPDGAAVRSATEIIERVKQLTANESGAYGRLIMEIVVPVVRRLIEIAWNKKLIPQRIPVDQLLIRVRVTSPMAAARRAKAVERTIQFLAMGMQIAPQVMQLIIDQEALLLELAAAFGVERKFIRDQGGRDKIKAQVQAIIAQALAAQQAQAQAAAAPAQAPPVPAAV